MNDRKTLYERLKPEYLEKLVENRDKWPNLAKRTEEALSNNYWVLDLTVADLGYICDTTELQDWNRIYDLFEDK
jgi:hypothetical protein